MEELYTLVAKKTGLSHDQSKMVVGIVIDFIKKKLPAPVAAELDAVVSGKSDLGAAEELLGGLFGGKK